MKLHQLSEQSRMYLYPFRYYWTHIYFIHQKMNGGRQLDFYSRWHKKQQGHTWSQAVLFRGNSKFIVSLLDCRIYSFSYIFLDHFAYYSWKRYIWIEKPTCLAVPVWPRLRSPPSFVCIAVFLGFRSAWQCASTPTFSGRGGEHTAHFSKTSESVFYLDLFQELPLSCSLSRFS